MNIPAIGVTRSLLLDPALTPAAKLLWIVLRRHGPLGPSHLAARAHIARSSVLRALPALVNAGWCTVAAGHRATPIYSPAAEATVTIPASLLSDPRVGIRGKLLYGILQLTPGFYSRTGQFTYASLSPVAGKSINALKRAVRDLVAAGWLRVAQKNRLAPLCFTLANPVLARVELEVKGANRRLDKAEWSGEVFMREYLSLLVDSDRLRDNTYPHFLFNPWTGDRLQLDRFYPPGVAFEFNGSQHDGVTERFADEDEAERQWARDGLKLGLCIKANVRLVIVRAEDLSLEGMRRKVGNLLPLRDLAGKGALIELLENRSRGYRREAAGGR